MKVPILSVTRRAYYDAFRAAFAMPAMAAVVLLICLADTVATEMIQQWLPLSKLALGFAVSVVFAFMVTPFLIAVHRYILLGEVTTGCRIDVRSRRFRRFFAYSLLLIVILES